MGSLLDFISSGLVIFFIILGLIGIVVPLLPGTLLIWVAVLVHMLANGFETVPFVLITIIAVVTGTSDYWMALLGAKTGGASGRSLLFGFIGAIVGSFILPLIGTIIGYAAGVLFSEYQEHEDWNEALRAGVGGLAGWGIATAIQFGGGILMLIIFLVGRGS